MIIMENALPDPIFQYLNDQILNENFPWFYTKTTGPIDDSDNPYVYSFFHRFYEDCIGITDHQLKPIVEACIHSIVDKAGLQLKQIYRSRTNLETIKPIRYHHSPHIDDTRKHYAAVLYMNDSDGDTIFYKQKFDASSGRSWQEDYVYVRDYVGFEIDKTITPKANKVVIFDGITYHSSFAPVESHSRYIINFTFTTPQHF